MTEKEMNALLHELRCRDEYALSSSGEQFVLRELWDDLPEEREALKTLWGPMFPDDLAGVLVAHDRSVELWQPATALRSQYPMFAVMVLYTVFGLVLMTG